LFEFSWLCLPGTVKNLHFRQVYGQGMIPYADYGWVVMIMASRGCQAMMAAWYFSQIMISHRWRVGKVCGIDDIGLNCSKTPRLSADESRILLDTPRYFTYHITIINGICSHFIIWDRWIKMSGYWGSVTLSNIFSYWTDSICNPLLHVMHLFALVKL
jgi:hypothetical protein